MDRANHSNEGYNYNEEYDVDPDQCQPSFLLKPPLPPRPPILAKTSPINPNLSTAHNVIGMS